MHQSNNVQRGFASLPLELFVEVLGHLVGPRDCCQLIARSPSDPVSKALRALTQVSRAIYLAATPFLYSNCVYLDDCTKYSRFRRTVGLGLGQHPEALQYGQASRNDALFHRARALEHVTSVFLSPQKTPRCDRIPMVRLPQIIDLGLAIGRTLKRLAIDLQPVYASTSELLAVKPHTAANNIFLHMPVLEELICSYDVPDYFPRPPPNLKKLAMTVQDLTEVHLDFFFSISSLVTLFFLRPQELTAAEIDDLFARYRGRHLDIVLVGTVADHSTPVHTRSWNDDDRVTIWQADVPTSFYGDEDYMVLCDGWIWSHGVKGTLWAQERRRMPDWKTIEAMLA